MPPSTVKPPPPYSCTRVRALKGCGVTSSVRRSGFRSTTTLRPPSPGRLSSQYTSLPSITTSASPTTPLTIKSEEIGDLQEPYGATPRSDIVRLLRVTLRRFSVGGLEDQPRALEPLAYRLAPPAGYHAHEPVALAYEVLERLLHLRAVHNEDHPMLLGELLDGLASRLFCPYGFRQQPLPLGCLGPQPASARVGLGLEGGLPLAPIFQALLDPVQYPLYGGPEVLAHHQPPLSVCPSVTHSTPVSSDVPDSYCLGTLRGLRLEPVACLEDPPHRCQAQDQEEYRHGQAQAHAYVCGPVEAPPETADKVDHRIEEGHRLPERRQHIHGVEAAAEKDQGRNDKERHELQLLEALGPDAEDEAEETEGEGREHEEQDHQERVRDLKRHEQARRGQDDQAENNRLGRCCPDVTDDDLDVGDGSRQDLVDRAREFGEEDAERRVGDALRKQRQHDQTWHDEGAVADPVDVGDA